MPATIAMRFVHLVTVRSLFKTYANLGADFANSSGDKDLK